MRRAAGRRRELWGSCKKWSAAIDELIVRAPEGGDVAAVRAEADAPVGWLAAALRGRIADAG